MRPNFAHQHTHTHIPPTSHERIIIAFDSEWHPVTWSEVTSESQYTVKFQDLPSCGHLLILSI